MAVNRVEVDGETKLDLTADTVTPETLLKGATAHNAAGEAIVGSIIMPTYTLVVKTSPSAAITVTKGTKTFSGTADASGECTFSLPEVGVWTVSINGVSQTVIVGTQEVSLAAYDSVFANNTWAQIVEACHYGLVPDTWAIADQKNMNIGGTDYVIDIIGKKHDDYADNSGKAPLTFQMHDLYVTTYNMTKYSSYNGWRTSLMRSTHLPEILKLMPTEVQTGIRNVHKKAAVRSGSSTIETVSDALFLLSEVEIIGTQNNSYPGEGTQYAYYANGGSKIKTLKGSNTEYWTRSANNTNNSYMCTRGPGDYGGTSDTSNYHGVSVAYCF